MPSGTQWRLAIVAAAHLAATAALIFLTPALGKIAASFCMMPVLVGAACFGLRGGLLTAGVQVGLNAFVLNYVVYPPQSFDSSSMLGILFLLAAGTVVGNQHDLSKRLRKELARNEQLRVREQETLSAIPDAMIRVALDGTCHVQAAEAPGTLPQVIERVLGRALATEQQAALLRIVPRVRANGLAEGLTLEFPGAASHEVRCLPAADRSVLVVLRDVTEQRKLMRRVTAAENLASVGTMVAGLAHEINNPLTYVITNLTGARESVREDAGITGELDTALEGCWRIRDLVHDVLETTISRRDAIEPVFVPEVVETALSLVRPQTRQRATIHWKPEDVPPALAHRTKLIQVVVNLLTNASQAFTNSRTSANEILVRAYGDRQDVVITVTDNAGGMDETTRMRALEPFFTTKEPGQGSGLGLFLCNSIVESLGGRLQIDSELGKGTVVTVRLHKAEQTSVPEREIAPEAPTTDRESAHLRILVVDDEPEIRRAVKRILRPAHEVSLGENAAEVLQRLEVGERFDVILCDLLMPEMTGIELFREIERRFPEQAPRMVFMTGGATTDSARIFIERLPDRVISKPFRPEEIEAAVLALTDRGSSIARVKSA